MVQERSIGASYSVTRGEKGGKWVRTGLKTCLTPLKTCLMPPKMVISRNVLSAIIFYRKANHWSHLRLFHAPGSAHPKLCQQIATDWLRSTQVAVSSADAARARPGTAPARAPHIIHTEGYAETDSDP
jgi:hypothetical protein